MNQINDGKWCCFSVLESMQTQPAQPFSERIAHHFLPTVNQINDGKIMTQSARPFSEGIAHPFSPTTFDK
ncbi:MAG: hypothetical protein LBL62_05255 [Planctomycetaceae bacterium]|nr:hypothetical protein [Planctomycetaceae bacterium]